VRKDRHQKAKKYKKLGNFLIVVGIIIALSPLWTNIYSYVYQMILQEEPAIEVPDDFEEDVPREFSTAYLELPTLNVGVTVISGTSESDLKKAPGWYTQSALPGEGNTAIAAHRITYGGYFRNLDKLNEGDEIYLSFLDKKYIYQVEWVIITEPNNWSVIAPTETPALTLTTCHPLRGSSHRLIARAVLDRVEPRWVDGEGPVGG